MTLNREQLDAMRCEGCGDAACEHDPLVFHSRCHPAAPTWATYANGELRVTCAECDRPIATVAVASAVSL